MYAAVASSASPRTPARAIQARFSSTALRPVLSPEVPKTPWATLGGVVVTVVVVLGVVVVVVGHS